MSRNEPIEGFHEPRQERSRRTLSRITDAAESLLLEAGPEAVTVQNVVARADTSVGAFYTRFRSKDDAVAWVHGRFWDDVRARWLGFLAPRRWRGVPAGVVVAEVVRRYTRIFLGDDGRGRAFLLELLGRQDDRLLARIRTLDSEIAAAMGRLMEERVEELDRPPAKEAAEEGFLTVLSAVRDRVLFGDPGRAPDSTAGGAGSRPGAAGARGLILSLTRMYGGHLGVRELPASYGDLLALCADAGGKPLRDEGDPSDRARGRA